MNRKIHIRCVSRVEGCNVWWHDEWSKEILRKKLNDFGFYVLTGKFGDSLEVYVLVED